ncbi:MAG: DUF222 domain-containing protein [Acidimicrobiia bacterium]
MSALRSVIDGLIASDVSDYADHEIEEELTELGRALDVLQARFLRLTAEADRRQTFVRDGILSTSRFLALTCDMANSTARERVAVARSLEGMPGTAAAFETGDLSYSKVRLLARAAGAHPEIFREHEDTLLEVAGRLTVRDLQRAIEYWRHNLDGPDALLEMTERSYVHVARTWEGMVRIDGLLDPESGETRDHRPGGGDAAARCTCSGRAPAHRGEPTGGGDGRRLSELPRSGRDDVGRRAAPPHRAGGHRDAGASRGIRLRGRSHRVDPRRNRPPPRLRCQGHPGDHQGTLPAPRRGPGLAHRHPRPAEGGGRPGPALPVPGLRPACPVVRRSPSRPLGRRRSDRPR